MANTYRFPPAERIGFMMGMSGVQVGALGAAMTVFMVGMLTGAPHVGVPLAIVVAIVGAGKWAGVPFRNRVAHRVGWVSSGSARKWTTPIGASRHGEISPCLKGFEVLPIEGTGQWQVGPPIGLIRCRGLVSVTFPVEGPQLALLGSNGVDQRVGEWGNMLASLCTERVDGGVARISWTDVHSASDPQSSKHYHRQYGKAGPASEEYAAHLEATALSASHHEVYVTVTVSTGTARRTKTLTTRKRSDINGAVLAQATTIASELRKNGYRVGRPLAPIDVTQLVRKAGDPWLPRRSERSATERLGVAEVGDETPASVVNEQMYVKIDSAVHRVFQVTWPKRDVPGDWMWNLLAAAGGPKVSTIVFEPVAPSTSRSRVERQLTRVTSDAAVQKKRKGRVSERREAIKRAVEEREGELGGGHKEMEVLGLIVVSARTLEDLEDRCRQVEAAAVRCGDSRVRALENLHDAGWAAALPIGMPVGRPKE